MKSPDTIQFFRHSAASLMYTANRFCGIGFHPVKQQRWNFSAVGY